MGSEMCIRDSPSPPRLLGYGVSRVYSPTTEGSGSAQIDGSSPVRLFFGGFEILIFDVEVEIFQIEIFPI